MRKAIEESKRSIHSTRIDVIAGEPVPIAAKSVLPVNPITRPEVEDPEYLPDSVSELAASLSALARITPPGRVREIYRAVRDIVDRIAPVTRTSLDSLDKTNLREAKSLEDLQKQISPDRLQIDAAEVINQAESVITQIQDAEASLKKTKETNYSKYKLKQLEKMMIEIVKNYRQFERAEVLLLNAHRDEKMSTQNIKELTLLSLNARIKLFNAMDEYRKVSGDPVASHQMKTTAISSMTRKALESEVPLTGENEREIVEAFQQFRRSLLAAGDELSRTIASSVESRLSAVEKEINAMKERDAFHLSRSLYAEITSDSGDLSQLKMEVIPLPNQKVKLELHPYFAPGSVILKRVHSDDDPVAYDPDSSFLKEVSPTQYVHVYEREVQMFDGSTVRVRPDVDIAIDEIKTDFIDNTAEYLRNQGVPNPEAVAADYFELNKRYIVRDAINTARGTMAELRDRDETGAKFKGAKFRKVKNTPERAALELANRKLDQIESLEDKLKTLSRGGLEEEITDLFDAGMNPDDVTNKMASIQRAVRKEDMRSVIDAVWGDWSSAERERVGQEKRLKRDISGMLKQVISLPGRPEMPAGEQVKMLLTFQQKALESFDVVSSGNSTELKKRKIKLDQELEQQESNEKIQAEIAAILVDRAIPAANALDTQQLINDPVVRRVRGALKNGLVQIVDDKLSSIESAFDVVSVDNPEAESLSGFRSAQLMRAETERLLKTGKQNAQSATSMQTIAKMYAVVSPLGVDTVNKRVEFNRISLEILQENIGDVIRSAIDKYVNSQMDSDRFARVIVSSYDEIVPAVSRFVADLEKIRGVKGETDFYTLVNLATNELGIGGRNLPVFAEGDLQKEIASFAATKRTSVLKYSTASMLFGVQDIKSAIERDIDKVPKPLAPSASLQTPLKKDAAESLSLGSVPPIGSTPTQAEILASQKVAARAKFVLLSRISSGAASISLHDVAQAFSDSDNLLNVLRALVAISCHVYIDLHQQSEKFLVINKIVDSIVDMVTLGTTSPSIRLRAFARQGGEVQRPVAVDDDEVGVGLFADVSGNSVIRVVSAATPGRATKSVDYEFIDPTLESEFVSAVNGISDIIVGKRGISKSAEQYAVVQAEVRRHLMSAMKTAAASVNEKFMTSKQMISLGQVQSVPDFQKKMRDIIEDSSRTRFSRDVAAVALNYSMLHEKIPPNQIPYYTPVRTQGAEDPATGTRLLKTSFDHVKQTFSLSSCEPSLKPLPDPLTQSFINDVLRLVDLHVLTHVGDMFGSVQAFRKPRADLPAKMSPKMKALSKKMGKPLPSQRDIFLIPLEMKPSYAGESIIIRSPAMLNQSQVLTVGSRISPDITIKQRDELIKEAKQFILQMMHDEASYLSKNAADRKKKVRSILPEILRANDEELSEILKPAARELLSAVQDHVIDRTIEYASKFVTKVIKEKDTGIRREILVSKSDVEAESAKRARGNLVQKFGEKHFDLLGYKGKLPLAVDPETGNPDLPPSPQDFLREKGMLRRSDRESLLNPNQYYARLTSALKEYEDLLDKYRVARIGQEKPGQKDLSKQIDDVLRKLSSDFPSVVSRADMIARQKMGEIPSISEVPDISTVSDAGKFKIAGLADPPATSQLTELVQRLTNTRESIEVVVRKRGNAFLYNTALTDIDSKIRRLNDFIGEFSIRREAGLLPSFALTYSQCVKAVNEVNVQIREDVKNTQDSSLTLEDVRDACLEELKKMQASPEENKALVDGISESLERIESILQSVKQKAHTQQGQTEFKLPTFSQVAEDLIKQAERQHAATVKHVDELRRKANIKINAAQREIDNDLRAMAVKSIKFLRNNNLVEIYKIDMDNFMIVNTPEELAAFRDTLIEDKEKSILTTMPTSRKLSDADMAKVRSLAQEYADVILGHMLFGVRHIPSQSGESI